MRSPTSSRIALAILIALLAACSRETASEWKTKPTFSVQPEPDTVLEISGLVNGGAQAYFTLEQLRALPRTEFSSEDPWVPGLARYGGVALYPLLQALKLDPKAHKAMLTANNDYSVTLDLDLLRTHRYALTWEEDGKLYAEYPDERNKGPLSLAFPHEEISGVDMEEQKLNYIWWLAKILVTE